MIVEVAIWTLGKYKGVLKGMKHWRNRWIVKSLDADTDPVGPCPSVRGVTIVRDCTSVDPFLS